MLGTVRVPASKTGDFPAIKRPEIDLDAIKVKSPGLTGAELALEIALKNPNAFSMLLEHFQYEFDVNGKSWGTGDAVKEAQVAENSESRIEIPISLNFFQMGQSAYESLRGGEDPNYQFRGNLDLAISLLLLEKANFSFSRSGLAEVRR